MAAVGFILLVTGSLLTAMNFYLSFLRYPLFKVSGGSQESYQWVSGIPLLGSLLLWISIALLPFTPWGLLAAIVSLLDTGGIHWFAGTMLWKEGIKPRLESRA